MYVTVRNLASPRNTIIQKQHGSKATMILMIVAAAYHYPFSRHTTFRTSIGDPTRIPLEIADDCSLRSPLSRRAFAAAISWGVDMRICLAARWKNGMATIGKVMHIRLTNWHDFKMHPGPPKNTMTYCMWMPWSYKRVYLVLNGTISGTLWRHSWSSSGRRQLPRACTRLRVARRGQQTFRLQTCGIPETSTTSCNIALHNPCYHGWS